MITEYLGQAAFFPVVASDGVTGLELARQIRPDLVVLDVILPRLDGFRFCRNLRVHSQVPVIMVTSLGGEEDRLRGLEVGADDYVTKPFSPRELVLRVQAVLRRTYAMPLPDQKPISADMLRVRLNVGATRARQLVHVVRAEYPSCVSGRPAAGGQEAA